MKNLSKNNREKKTSRRGKMLMMNDKRNNNVKPDADWLLLPLAGAICHEKEKNGMTLGSTRYISPVDVHTRARSCNN